jgi:dolichyl-phosphate beta-glucosyltransferase
MTMPHHVEPGDAAGQLASPPIGAPPVGVDATPHVSLVIPAYNEERRIAHTLEAAIAHLATQAYASEILVVLDGCTDRTLSMVAAHIGPHGNCDLRVFNNATNRGKGACVRQGMLAARGHYRFFTDADLSYPLHQLDPFLDALMLDGGVAIASRDSSSVRYQRPVRRLVTVLSRIVMSRLFVPGIQDTQAGLKGFTQAVADDLFGCQRLTGFGFDVEILHVAAMRGYTIRPMPVEWHDVPGSKVRLIRDIGRMGLELAAIGFNRLAGRYRRKP